MIFLLSLFPVLLGWSAALSIGNLTTAQFRGTLTMFAVPRTKVQEKLDQYNSGIPCQEKRLTLPNKHILPEFLNESQHVVSVDSGMLTALSIEEALAPSVADRYSLEAPTVQFVIPFLSGDDPDGLPVYTLALDSFVSTTKPFIQPNIALPTTQVEKIVYKKRSISIEDADGDDYFSVSWEEEKVCRTLNYVVATDINHFLDEVLLPFNHDVSFSLCGRSDARDLDEVDLCKSRAAIGSDVSRNRFDACQTWGPAEQEKWDEVRECILKSYRLESISKRFQNISLLSMDNPVPIIFADAQSNNYVNIGIKFPCIE